MFKFCYCIELALFEIQYKNNLLSLSFVKKLYFKKINKRRLY